MASTVLPNGIIIPEKYSRDWYADLYHNWQELDNLLAGGGGGANDGTLTIQKNGDTVGTFSANQATDETINITVPDVNDGTLTIQQNGTTVDTFSANSSTDKTVNIAIPTKTSDLTNDSDFVQSSDLATVATSGSYNDLSNKPTIPTVNNATLTIQQNGTTVDTFTANASVDKTININTADDTKIPLAGSNAISGDLIPETDNSIDIGSSTKNIKALYTKGITIDGKTVDTDANDNMTYDGHIVDTIEEQGNGYIRYTNGIQICWGSVDFGSIEAGGDRVLDWIFSKSFVNSSYIAVCGNSSTGSQWRYQSFITFDKTTTLVKIAVTNIGTAASGDSLASLIAIGKWK